MIENDTAAPPASVVARDTAPACRTGLGRQWYLVGVLAAIYVLNYIDRGALNLIIDPIKADLHITDVQMSLLIGLSFAALYSFLSIPAGYLADIMSRRLLLGSAIIFWSCMASVCGFAGNYWQLFAGRVGLGVGEAVLPPTAYSLLRDGVRPEHRARAFSIYHLGTGVGTALGALIGGALFALGSHDAFHGVPIIGDLKPWQLVIAIPGLCGILASYLVFTIREPARMVTTTGPNASTFGDLFRYVRQHRRVYAPLFASIVFGPMAVSAWGAWLPTAIGRSWGLPTSQIGHMTGILSLIALPFNALVIGYFMDRVAQGGTRRHATVWLAIGIGLTQLIPAMFILLAPSIPLMWTGYALSMLLTNATGVAGGLSLAQITPSQLMGKATSFYFLVANLLGLAIGPTVVALISAWLFTGRLAIIHSMMLCYPLLTFCNVLFLGIFAVQLRRSQRRSSGIIRT
jgi:MFS family permease